MWLGGPVLIAPAHPVDYAWASALLPRLQPGVRVFPQTDGNLGQRLNVLDHELRSSGLKQLIYIGSDAPALTAADYAAVNNTFSCYDSVLMPAEDGGVVLMASCRQWPMLSGLPWSIMRLGAALADCCCAVGQSVAMLTQSFDVDEEDDLFRLVTAMKMDHRPARRALAYDLVQLREASHV